MGSPHEPDPAALIAGITYKDTGALDKAVEFLRKDFGDIEFSAREFAFDMTDYYREEMGEGLFKRFFCFRRPISPETLPEVKLRTNTIEILLARCANGGMKRRVNIDPGYVTLAKLTLATTKDYSHRIYLGRGIFAENTLRFVRGAFIPFETAYPDYRTQEAIEFFTAVREFVKRNRSLWTRENASSS